MGFLNRIKLQTPESVELEFTLAGIANRASALLIDYIIWGIILTLALLQLVIINSVFAIYDYLGLWFLAIQFLVIFAIYVGYFVLFETIWQGQTPGKKNVKIRVICDDGKTVRLPQATLRALLRPIDDLLFIGAFLIMLTPKEKRLGDLVAGTIVIQEEVKSRPKIKQKFTLSPEAKVLAEELVIEADLSLLSPEDFGLIREYLERRDEMFIEARLNLSKQIAEQIKQKIQLETLTKKVTANVFLEAVYIGYQKQD